MEHITVTLRANGTVKLIPERGYVLVNLRSGAEYSEACCKAENAVLFAAKGKI